jgi:hypothetical protein
MTWLVSTIITAILNWLSNLVGKLLARKKDQDEAVKKIEEQAQANTDQLMKAKTEQEVDDAASQIAKDSF